MIRFARLMTAMTAVIILTAVKLQAAGDPILYVDYVDSSGEVTKSQSFSLDELREMDVTSFETETIWTEGAQSFTGVSLAGLVTQLGAGGSEIEAVAINEYSVSIPLSDAVQGGPILAFERNGTVMSIRNKGPLWLVYPYDSDPSYRTEAFYSRSIWQLEKIILKQ